MRENGHVPLQAVLLICASTLCFAFLDSAIKFLSTRYPVPLLVWARWSIQAFALVVWLAPKAGTSFIKTPYVAHNLVRGAVLLGSSICFMTALRDLPLAEATALNYSTPVLVVVLALFFLDERLTVPRLAFVLAGVLGMLLIVRPGTDVFQGASLLALAAAVFYATFQVMTRRMSDENPGVLLFYPALVGMVGMGLVVPFTVDMDVSMPWTHIALLLGAGMLGTFGHFLFVLAFQRGSATALTPFTYFQLIWATLIGWVVFANFPDFFALVGMSIIAGSGLLITLHERRRAQADQKSAQAPPDPTAID